MKISTIIQLLGFRGRPKRYPYKVIEYDLGGAGVVKYPQWKHPGESTKVMSAELVDAYREYIQEGAFCIDIGAHCGDTTLPMAVAAGLSGCVLALEPNPFVYPVLEKTARANSHTCNIKTMMAAAGRTEGFMEFEYSDSGFCNGGRHENISLLKHGHAYKQTVFVVNLEHELRSDYSALLPRLRFVKTDAEGYDLSVLQSLHQIIREYRPVVKSEVYKKTSQNYRNEMLSFFDGLDYTAWKIRMEPLERGDLLRRETLGSGNHYDILALPNEMLR